MKCKNSLSRASRGRVKMTRPKLPGDYPWKVLSALVQDLMSHLAEDDCALISQIIRDRDIDAYLLLDDIWGLQAINNGSSITPSVNDISSIRAKYQISSLLKKFQFKTKKAERRAKAIDVILKAEMQCKAFNDEGYKTLLAAKTETDACMLSDMRAFIQKVLGKGAIPNHSIIVDWSRHGPGSNLDTHGAEISLFHKFENWPYSCSRRSIPYARYLIESDKRWLGALEESYRRRFNIPAHEILNYRVFWENVLVSKDFNAIAFVPKDVNKDRSIAKEPAISLMLQLGVDGYIRTRLRRFGIDLNDQRKNQRLAYQGSIRGNFSTIDLKAASDTISLRLCKELLPPDWFTYLYGLRSVFGRSEADKLSITYEKMSSMGNGYTFALESLIFAAVCYAATKSVLKTCDPHEDFSVFGDDLVVRTDCTSEVVRLLNLAGFQTNLEKTFLQGPIRESCGSDWYLGKHIRPIFLKELPEEVTDLFTDLNRLKRNLDLYWGLEESNTENLIRLWIPLNLRFTGPCSDTQFDSYIHSKRFTSRWKNCMFEYRVLVKNAKTISKTAWSDFLFRKLMHNLKVLPPPSNNIIGVREKGAGSRFRVIQKYSYTLSVTYSRASYWPAKYNFPELVVQ